MKWTGSRESEPYAGGEIRSADIDEGYKAIRAHGVEFRREPHVVHRTEEYELWMAGFFDPEGNFIHLMSEVSP